MDQKGSWRDNATTRSWFNSFKNGPLGGVRYATHAKLSAETFEYIEFFCNRKRLRSTLGYKSPVKALDDWNQQPQN